MDPLEELLRRQFGGGKPKGKKKADNKRLYKVLGLEPTASLDAIKKAHKELLKKAQGNKPRLAEIEEAFEVLSNKERREAYDKHGEASLKGEAKEEEEEEEEGPEGEGGEPDIQNLFEMLRGGAGKPKKPAKPQRKKLKPMQFALEATLDEIYTGAKTKMRINRMRVCKSCSGKGCKPGAYSATCQTCEGRRVVMKLVQMGPGMYAQARAPCDDCHGSGDTMSEEDKCPACKGEKILEEQKELEVKLDPGVPDNHVYNFPGEGNEVPEADAGDVMYVVKQKPHDKFKRRGADLITEQEITLEEALTGGKFTIDHLGGKKTTLNLEAGRIVKPNDILVVDELGMPDFRAPGSFGKLYLIVSVKFPAQLEEEKLATLIKSIENLDPKTKVSEEVKERLVMKDFHPNQKNLREDGEVGPDEHEEHDERHHEGGIPCQAQ